MCLKTEAVCSFPQFQSSLIAWTQERQSCQIRGRASLYSKSLKFSRAEITYSSTQKRQLWQKFWNHDSNWESGKICHLSFLSTGDRLISPHSAIYFALNEKRSIFCSRYFFSHLLSPSTQQIVADFCLLFDLKLGQSNCIINQESLRAPGTHQLSPGSTYVG